MKSRFASLIGDVQFAQLGKPAIKRYEAGYPLAPAKTLGRTDWPRLYEKDIS